MRQNNVDMIMHAPHPRPIHAPVIGPRLKQVLLLVLVLFTVLAINASYLGGVTLLEWSTGEAYQGYFYQYMFLVHLVLGLLVIAPVLIFGSLHLRNARKRPNRQAVRAGLGLFACALVLLFSGLLLVRFDFFEIKHPAVRDTAYWLHVITPLLCAWLFVLHRLAGKRIRWRTGLGIGAAGALFAGVMIAVQAQDPRQWNTAGPASGEQYFFPSLARTATGNFIPARTLMMDQYCKDCHTDVHEQWQHSAHRLSSFNNPAYLFSVSNTRKVALERDGDVQAARFCAGCHDPVPFFSGAFDDPEFDDVHHPTARVGITCTSCHAITHINSPRGNADFTIEEPSHYPFAFSENGFLQWVNRQLVKAKPEFHSKTFLKPLHKSEQFCGTCHKVHLPEELNRYKWLRGQNHYDTYLLSGVSGHGAASFYYPPKAEASCNGCHMPFLVSEDFGARINDDSDELTVHDHMFPSANTALPHLLGLPEWVNEKHRDFLDGVMRLDIFGVREGGIIEGPIVAPLRPELPVLKPGEPYLLEVVIRTLKMGHVFTEGTADSNEVWVDVVVRSGEQVIGRSGELKPADKAVDPWSHFVNAYVLDRNGNRIDRRNAEDIFVPLYNHQIPPGAADVVHYRLQVPEDIDRPVTVEARLRYRKFDTNFTRHFQGEAFVENDLPITTLARDQVTFPVTEGGEVLSAPPTGVADWERWNDYGIGLLRKPQNRQLRQAEEAFQQVEAAGRADGALNLARVYLEEGRLDDAAHALHRAANHPSPAAPWSIAWFTGLVNKQNGYLDEAVANFESVVANRFAEARQRGFDFSRDYRVLNELGQTVFEQAKQQRGPRRKAERVRLLREAESWFEKAIDEDPENVTAHYNLALVYQQLGDDQRAHQHRQLHAKFKPDDNARDFAVTQHRRANPAADHSAEPVVIYDLHRSGAARPEDKQLTHTSGHTPNSS